MKKSKKQYSCNDCGSIFTKWEGKCAECGSWNSISEDTNLSSDIASNNFGTVAKLESLKSDVYVPLRVKTPIEEFNRVLGGGLVKGAAILIGGDPGIGKSTLLLQLCDKLAKGGIKSIYVTGEESSNQIKMRARRLAIDDDTTLVLAATNVEDIIATIHENKSNADLVIIDSIQTMATRAASSPPGTVSQVKASSHLLINYAKQNEITLLIACHVNKDGQLAGPKLLEHMVDTVLYFEGDHNNYFRLLRSMKNRFGGVNEIGVFEMTSKGLIEIKNPSELFLMERESNVSGSAVFAGIEGTRPILIEVQALISPSNMPTPRRSVVGWDPNRLSMIIAVLAVRYGLNLNSHEVYLTIAGGIRVTEPAVDLAVAAALISSARNTPLPNKSVFFGEIGLSGEIRRVAQSTARVKEAKKLGFEKMYCYDQKTNDDQVHSLAHVKQLKNII